MARFFLTPFFLGSFSMHLALAAPPVPGAPSAKTAVVGAPQAPAVDGADNKAPGELLVSVNWDQTKFQTGPGLFSLAGFQSGNKVVAADARYQDNLAYMGIGSLRYHTAESLRDSKSNPNGWLDFERKSWDADAIVAAVSAWQPKGVRKIVNIVGWPDWMDADKNGALDPDQYDAFATFCAELVNILNVKAGLGIQAFEVTNEKDGLYWIDPAEKGLPLRIGELADIYNRAAVAMKKVDPSIKVGGPAAMRPDQSEPLLEWVRMVLPQLDFLSVHMYASGDPKDPDIQIWDRTETFGDAASKLRAALDQISPDRHIGLFVNEFNVSWTWETQDPRMKNHIGAVFDALAMVELANSGVDMINAWNECDGVYGKMDSTFQLRPAAHVFHLFNKDLVGDVVESESSHPRRVAVFAVKSQGRRNVLLINRTGKPREVSLHNVASPGEVVTRSCIDANGFSTQKESFMPENTTLPAESVTLISLKNH